jgi:inner membrane transporter RhtA
MAVVAAQISMNLGAAIGKDLFSLLSPEAVAALRTGLAAILLLLLAQPWKARLTARHALWVGLYGLALGGMNLLIYWAFERLPIGVAVAIEICGPLAVVLIGSRSLPDFAWLALAITGLLLLVPWPGSEAPLDVAGLSFAAGAAACWALYIVFGKQASGVDNRTAVALGMAAACIITFPVGLPEALPGLFVPTIFLTGLALALLSSALPYLLELKALEGLSPRAFGVVTSSAPAIAAVVGFVLLGEKLAPLQWLAIALLIGASAGCALCSARPPASAATH